MRIMKLSSILLLSMFFLWAFIPEASAARCKSRTSFGLSFNVGGPAYVAPAPAYVAPAPAYVAPAPYPAYVAPAPYPYYYSAPVVVQRPGYYVQPGVSYSYWRY